MADADELVIRCLTPEQDRMLREIHAVVCGQKARTDASANAPSRWVVIDDPKVRTVPQGWRGDDFRGFLYSECPPEFLDVLATTHDAFAARRDRYGNPRFATVERAHAAKARHWAELLRQRAL